MAPKRQRVSQLRSPRAADDTRPRHRTLNEQCLQRFFLLLQLKSGSGLGNSLRKQGVNRDGEAPRGQTESILKHVCQWNNLPTVCSASNPDSVLSRAGLCMKTATTAGQGGREEDARREGGFSQCSMGSYSSTLCTLHSLSLSLLFRQLSTF